MLAIDLPATITQYRHEKVIGGLLVFSMIEIVQDFLAVLYHLLEGSLSLGFFLQVVLPKLLEYHAGVVPVPYIQRDGYHLGGSGQEEASVVGVYNEPLIVTGGETPLFLRKVRRGVWEVKSLRCLVPLHSYSVPLNFVKNLQVADCKERSGTVDVLPMDSPIVTSAFSPEIPCRDAWPYRRAYSDRSIVYYEMTEETTLPVYSDRFWSLVGRNIKVLGQLLVQNGCHFVPQSEGQFLAHADVKELWNALKAEEKVIRKEGLALTNFETGEKIVFRNPEYRALWPSFEDFESAMLSKQSLADGGVSINTGLIYLLMPPRFDHIIEKISKGKTYKSEYTDITVIYDMIWANDKQDDEHRFSLSAIMVDCDTPEQRSREWENITNTMYNLLKGE